MRLIELTEITDFDGPETAPVWLNPDSIAFLRPARETSGGSATEIRVMGSVSVFVLETAERVAAAIINSVVI